MRPSPRMTVKKATDQMKGRCRGAEPMAGTVRMERDVAGSNGAEQRGEGSTRARRRRRLQCGGGNWKLQCGSSGGGSNAVAMGGPDEARGSRAFVSALGLASPKPLGRCGLRLDATTIASPAAIAPPLTISASLRSR
ncbi:hypothetical protein GUJ93_ZPchr0007g5517 [Zizania palustris]|uniref:Uncharacterized protein n=1 Tax=Zizania palustris TaxID=103762 RepID=A0A8J5TG14_ZIZPA|nr:hypothetical protein GUJ93_ZPchr0007g5517 [Zizania palustris]